MKFPDNTIDTGLSECCSYPVRTVNGDKGTSYWKCTNCGKPCDTQIPTKPKPSTTPELDEKLKRLMYLHHISYPKPEDADEFVAGIRTMLIEAEEKIAKNALVISEYWLEEDGRPKHLIQDLRDVRDISVLHHIPQKYIDQYHTGQSLKDNQGAERIPSNESN